jgi:hypothetical protein
LVLEHESERVFQRQESLRIKAMMPEIHQLLARVRSSLAYLSTLAKKLSGKKAPDKEFAPQRMCPFCGLITARGKVHCLECGKSLKPA